MEFICNKCSSKKLFIQSQGSQTGLYCQSCGKWIKWMSKEEIRIFEYKNSIHDLSNISTEELLKEIKKRVKGN
jgi:uncharacterized Zn finger protein